MRVISKNFFWVRVIAEIGNAHRKKKYYFIACHSLFTHVSIELLQKQKTDSSLVPDL
jgi:hypothetical protein